MKSKLRDGTKERDDNASLDPNSVASKQDSEKSGFMKIFLKWIARGTDQLRMSGTSCPS